MFVILEPSSEGINLIAAAKRLGENVAVVTANSGDRAIAAGLLAQADRVIQVDTNDESAVLASLQALAQEHRLTAIAPGFEYYVPTAARLARHFDLPGMS